MEQDTILLDKVASHFDVEHPVDADITLSYTDEDIVMIDNVKFMANPNPVRLKVNIVAFCIKGKIQAVINGQVTQFGQNQLLICPPNTTISDFLLSPDFDFKAILVSNSMLQSFLHEKMSLWTEVLYIHKMHVITLDEEDIRTFMHFYDLLSNIFTIKKQVEYKPEVVQSFLRGAFLHLCGLLKAVKQSEAIIQSSVSQSGALFQRFLDFLGKSTVKRRPVEYYAGELCITPKYLSMICKKHSGKTANEWIREHTLEDIRYYLKQTDLTMTQIADRLGFPNPSFFGKYVKEHFGMTPAQFRQKTVGGSSSGVL